VEVEAPMAVPHAPSSRDLVASSSCPSCTEGRLLHQVSAWRREEAFMEVQVVHTEEDLRFFWSRHAEAVGELVSFQMGHEASRGDGGKNGGKGKERAHD